MGSIWTFPPPAERDETRGHSLRTADLRTEYMLVQSWLQGELEPKALLLLRDRLEETLAELAPAQLASLNRRITSDDPIPDSPLEE